MAMLYEDYMKVRNAKVGETVVLSTGEKMNKKLQDGIYYVKTKPTKNCSLDFYDRTYVG